MCAECFATWLYCYVIYRWNPSPFSIMQCLAILAYTYLGRVGWLVVTCPLTRRPASVATNYLYHHTVMAHHKPNSSTA